MQRSRLAAVGALIAAVLLIVALWWQAGDRDRAERSAASETPAVNAGEREPAATEAADAPPVEAQPEPPPFDPKTGLTGLVLDPEKRPVAGATVEITLWHTRLVGVPPDFTTETGADGRFEVGPLTGKLWVSAHKSGVGAGGVAPHPLPGGRVVIRLVPGARLRGRVYDEADKTPIPGVLVVGKMAGDGWTFERATTDEQGRFRLLHLALDASLTFHPREHRQHIVKPRLKLGGSEPLEIALSRSPLMRGQVVDADTQEPVVLESVEVRLWHNRPVRLLGEGRFELHATRSQTQFTVRAKGYPRTRLYFNPGVTEQTFNLAKGELVQVHVQDDNGRALSGASVKVEMTWLQIHMQDIDAARTDDSGNADIRIIPKRRNFRGRAVRVSAELDGYYGTPVETDDFSRGVFNATVVLSPAAALEGRVVNASAEPLSGAQCVLEGPHDLTREHTTGLDGRFSLRSLPRGRLSLVVTAPGLSIHRQDVEITRAGDNTLPDIVLSAGESIAGSVVDARGRALPKLLIWASDYGSSKLAARGTVDEQGRFTLDGLTPDALYNIFVGVPPLGRVLETIPQVKAGTTLPITVEEYSEIRGRLVLDGKQALGVVHVRCSSINEPGKSPIPDPETSTYADGTFEVLGVKPGRYRITVQSSNHISEPVEITVAAGEIADVRVPLTRAAFVEGKLEPPERATVFAVPEGEPLNPSKSRAYARVAEDGSFKLGPLPPGRYHILPFLVSSSRALPVIVEVSAGETAQCRVVMVEPGSLRVDTGAAGQPIALQDADGAAVPLSGPEERAQLGRLSRKLADRGDDIRKVDGGKMVRNLLVKTDADGEWQRLALLPGTYTVEFTGERHQVEIVSGQKTELDLREG